MKTQLACMALLCILLGAGCSGSKHRYEVSSADTTAIINNTDSAVNPAKLVKTADMHFKVKDVEHVSEDISALTAKIGGMVMHHAMQSQVSRSENVALSKDSVMRISSKNTTADMVVKIPSAKIDDFLNQISKGALHVDRRNMDIQDKTLDYLSAQLKFESRTELVAQQKTGKVIIKNPTAVMNLKDDLIDGQIDNKRIDNAVKYSTVALSFYQSNTISREVIVNDNPSNFRLPFFRRLANAFENGWVIFADTLIGLANIWMFILAAVAGWIAFKRLLKRKVVVVG